MIKYLLDVCTVSPATILVIELFLTAFILKKIHNLFALTNKSIHLLRTKRVSDHWKEKILPYYAARMMKMSLLLGGFFLLLFIIFTTVLHLTGLVCYGKFNGVKAIQQLDYVFAISFVSIIYLFLRRLIRS